MPIFLNGANILSSPLVSDVGDVVYVSIVLITMRSEIRIAINMAVRIPPLVICIFHTSIKTIPVFT